MWYWQRTYMHKSGIPIDVLLVVIELHFGVCSYLFEHLAYHFLLLRRNKNVTTPALEILVTSEVETEGSHELVVLLCEHMLLEVGESSGVFHWCRLALMLTVSFSHKRNVYYFLEERNILLSSSTSRTSLLRCTIEWQFEHKAHNSD